MQLSIIIPMYNESKYVGRCLDSLLGQTFHNFELIMIDDGSKDNTVKIVEGYNNKIHNLTILHQKHGGPGKARNRGASIAKGEILIFIDADMVFDKKYLEELIKPIVEGKEIGTAHGWEYVANKDHAIARAFSLIRLSYNPKDKRSGVFRAIRKEVFIESGGFDTSKGYSDDDLSKRIGSSLSIPGAIAYHNNPEGFGEIIKHSERVGASLVKSGEIKNYLLKYKLWVIVFIIGLLLLLYAIGLSYGLGAGIGLLFLLISIKGIQRAISERYRSHIVYVPLVMICRGLGYISGGFKYLFSKTVY
ncbi:MAG TPA: glycosyltransferase family 2 protein [Candidatus Absconditabacterales bacterium]|nr:glycosyltransferase family 2 protein [Candidatus Absconditabacterales bacterium]HNG97343.1 glycosyltransferase family 2 protein [Candidatus Absconditabacterales bacterium]